MEWVCMAARLHGCTAARLRGCAAARLHAGRWQGASRGEGHFTVNWLPPQHEMLFAAVNAQQ